MDNSAMFFGAKLAATVLATPPKHNDQAGVDVNPVAAGTPAGKETLTKKKMPVKAEDVVSPSKAAAFGQKLAGQVNFYERVPKDEQKKRKVGPTPVTSAVAAGESNDEDIYSKAKSEYSLADDMSGIKVAYEFGRRVKLAIGSYNSMPGSVPGWSEPTPAKLSVPPAPPVKFINDAADSAVNSDLAWALGHGAQHYGNQIAEGLQSLGNRASEALGPFAVDPFPLHHPQTATPSAGSAPTPVPNAPAPAPRPAPVPNAPANSAGPTPIPVAPRAPTAPPKPRLPEYTDEPPINTGSIGTPTTPVKAAEKPTKSRWDRVFNDDDYTGPTTPVAPPTSPAAPPAPPPGPSAANAGGTPATAQSSGGSLLDYAPAGIGAAGLAALAYAMMANQKKKKRDDEE